MSFLSSVMGVFGKSGRRIGSLLEASTSILGSGWIAFAPMTLLFVIKAGRAFLMLFLLHIGFVTKDWDLAFTLMIVALVYMPVEIVIQTFLQAAMATVSKDILIKGRSGIASILVSFVRNLPQLLFIGTITFLLHRAKDKKQEGFIGFLVALVIVVVSEVWDLVSNLAISAIVAENASIRTLVERLKQLRSHIPETLLGIIGIDLLGDVAKTIFAGGVVVGLFGGGAVGYFFADKLPIAFLADFGEFKVNFLPAFLILSLSFTTNAFITSAVVCAKSLYFTCLYMLVLQPEEIGPDHKKTLQQKLESGSSSEPRPS